jgi:hypothetical protein
MENMTVAAMSVVVGSALKGVAAKKIKHVSRIADGRIPRVRANKIVHPIPIRLLQNYWL